LYSREGIIEQCFISIDPLADAPNQVDKSPYAFAWNNPIYFVDPDGRMPIAANCCDGLKKWFSDAAAGLDKFLNGGVSSDTPVGSPRIYPRDRNPVGKNITGNYFGDAAYRLLGGETFSRALDGDPKAQFRVITAAELSLLPGGRGNPVDNIVDDLPILEFSRKSTPNIADNIEAAISDGAPSVLTRQTNKSQIRANRAAALRGKRDLATPGQTSLDEFPFASSREGGSGSRVQAVPIGEQNTQGGIMSQFFKKNEVKDGDKFKVRIKE